MSVDATRATWQLGKKVTAIQKLLLLALADRADELSQCWPSLKRLEEDTSLNRKTIIENRQTLINLGFLAYTGELKGKQKQIPVMRLTYVEHREGVVEEFTSTENGTGTSTENGTGTSTENGTGTSTENGTGNQYRKRDTEPKRLEPKKEPLGDSSNAPKNKLRIYQKDERFMRFYSIYPRKVKPVDALKAFKQVVGDDDVLLDAIVADINKRIKEHAQWRDKQYIPYPASYLRSADYESEIFNPENQERVKKTEAKRISDEAYAKRIRLQDEVAKRTRESKPSQERRGAPVRLADMLKNFKPTT